jgi:hypothetical protein
MKRIFFSLVLLSAGCGSKVAIKTPSGFADVTEQSEGGYDYRATSADGVVIAVKRIKREPRNAEPSFWYQAVENQLRQKGGYARLSSNPVKSADGVEGLQIVFGHDQNGHPFLYNVAVFLTPKTIVVAEFGGRKDKVDEHAAGLTASLQSLSVRD